VNVVEVETRVIVVEIILEEEELIEIVVIGVTVVKRSLSSKSRAIT
jgi:hypothetical protein